jgi:predicted kinase
VRIRADVERKRLFGLDARARSASALGGGLYTAASTAATYARLRELAQPLLEGGHCVVLDATFVQPAQRDAARQLAAQQGLPFFILDFRLDPALLRERVRARALTGGDASEADLSVLEAQLCNAQPLADGEQGDVVDCPADATPVGPGFEQRWAAVAQEIVRRIGARQRPWC